MKSIGIIGNGFVGSAIAEGFKQYTDVKIYDKKPEKSCHTLIDTISQDVVFVCLPTPMSLKDNGSCDLSYIENFFDECLELSPKCIFIIKSTVSIGATSRFKNKYKDFDIIHSPEFLTARTAVKDFANPTQIILGCVYERESYITEKQILIDLHNKYFSKSIIKICTSNESEIMKICINSFYAVKIQFFNEIFDFPFSFFKKKMINLDSRKKTIKHTKNAPKYPKL